MNLYRVAILRTIEWIKREGLTFTRYRDRVGTEYRVQEVIFASQTFFSLVLASALKARLRKLGCRCRDNKMYPHSFVSTIISILFFAKIVNQK